MLARSPLRLVVLSLFPPLLFVLPSPAGAFHTLFDYQVERTEVDGGPFGPADGTPWVCRDVAGSIGGT